MDNNKERSSHCEACAVCQCNQVLNTEYFIQKATILRTQSFWLGFLFFLCQKKTFEMTTASVFYSFDKTES